MDTLDTTQSFNLNVMWYFLWLNKCNVLCGDWWVSGATCASAKIPQDQVIRRQCPEKYYPYKAYNTCFRQNFPTVVNKKAKTFLSAAILCYNGILEKVQGPKPMGLCGEERVAIEGVVMKAILLLFCEHLLFLCLLNFPNSLALPIKSLINVSIFS